MSQNAANFSVGTDNAVARYDTTAGAVLQNSGVTITDADVCNGITQLNVDNLRLDGNTVSSTDTNGDVTIEPNGTGNINLSSDAVLQSEAAAGVSVSYSLINSSNTASATAFYNAQVAGATASDAYYKAEVASGQAWTWGLDNSASDEYSLSASATLGTSEVFHISPAGNVNFTNTVSGSAGTWVFTNTSNTASTSASIRVRAGGTSADDPYYICGVTGASDWSFGLDNSDSDKFKISWGASVLGTNDYFVLNTTGEITMPLQPAFAAYLSADIANVTGDATTYTIVWDSENFDRNSDFDTATGLFTAPVTGVYQFNTSVQIEGLVTVTNTSLYLAFRVNSEASTRRGAITYNPSVIIDATFGNFVSSSYAVLLTAGDTMGVSVRVAGGAKVVGVGGDATFANASTFSGYLVC